MLVKETAPRDNRFRLGMLGVCTACLLGGLALGGRTLLLRSLEGPSQADEVSAAADGFELPGDSGGKLLARLLSPRATLTGELEERRPRSFPAPRSVALPSEPLPPSLPAVPSLPRTAGKGLRPHLVLDEILDDIDDPIPPEVYTFSPGPRTSALESGSSDASELPALATAVPDRVPVEDVTVEASTAAALAAAMPVRQSLAPFLRLTVPDPYEHRRTVGPPAPADDHQPHTTSPQTPGR
jgi:hypothetical protein